MPEPSAAAVQDRVLVALDVERLDEADALLERLDGRGRRLQDRLAALHRGGPASPSSTRSSAATACSSTSSTTTFRTR